MEATREQIENLKSLGFTKQFNREIYWYKDIKANIFNGYVLFSYLGKDLPIISDTNQLKSLIFGLYQINV